MFHSLFYSSIDTKNNQVVTMAYIRIKEYSAQNIAIFNNVLPDKRFIISCADGLLLLEK